MLDSGGFLLLLVACAAGLRAGMVGAAIEGTVYPVNYNHVSKIYEIEYRGLRNHKSNPTTRTSHSPKTVSHFSIVIPHVSVQRAASTFFPS